MQAARGASLTTSDPDGTAGRRPSRRPWVFASALLLAYATDVVTKVLAVRELSDGRTVRVVGDVLTLHLIRNPGAAFSVGAAATEVLSVLAMVAFAVAIWYGVRARHRGWAVAVGLVAAGILGNLTDRLLRSPGPLRGHVVDFLRLPHWPIFNVADICIDVGAALIVLLTLRGIAHDAVAPLPDGPAAEER
jgi:signal peptidase II